MKDKNRSNILYTHSLKSSFVRKDIAILEKEFNLTKFFFNPDNKVLVPFVFLKQFFHLFIKLRSTDIYITQFAGYQSYLPSLFAKLFKKKSLIILGGSDCVAFPSINYGNFNKKVLGWFTKKSYDYCTHLAPVAKALIYAKWNYYSIDRLEQGVKVFAPKAKYDYRVLEYGYPSDKFIAQGEKIAGTFLMVGFLNTTNYFRKGVDLIVELAKRQHDLKFTVIGGKENVLKESCPENITMIESVSYDELQSYYAKSQFYLQISICEGFPSALCEAMLCECVPIVSDVAAMPNIVGDHGYILKEKSIDQFEALVKQAIQNYDAKMGELARQTIIDNYPLEKRSELVDYIQDILGQKAV